MIDARRLSWLFARMKPTLLISLSLCGLLASAFAEEKLPVPVKPAALPKDASGALILFDGKTLGNWKKIQFGGEGEVFVENGEMRVDQGAVLSGVVWNGEPPARINYEIELEAMKLQGDDFFLALTMPVNKQCCTFVCGGWGGGVVGVSSLNGLDASENETASVESFENKKWYKIKARVTDKKLQCWIDDRMVANVDIEGMDISMRPGDIELCQPLGLATYQTWAAYRNIRWRHVTP